MTGVIAPPDSIISMAPSLAPTFGVGVTNMGAILTDPTMWAVVVIFFLVAFFDTAGTLIGLAQQAGFMHNGKMPRLLPVSRWGRAQVLPLSSSRFFSASA